MKMTQYCYSPDYIQFMNTVAYIHYLDSFVPTYLSFGRLNIMRWRYWFNVTSCWQDTPPYVNHIGNVHSNYHSHPKALGGFAKHKMKLHMENSLALWSDTNLSHLIQNQIYISKFIIQTPDFPFQNCIHYYKYCFVADCLVWKLS